MNEPKFCKDCKHYRPAIGYPFSGYLPEICHHPSNISKPDLVDGRTYFMAGPRDLRGGLANCGPDGLLFEAKPPEPPAPQWVSVATAASQPYMPPPPPGDKRSWAGRLLDRILGL